MTHTTEMPRPWRRWYNTKRWKSLRAAQLQREPLCRMCIRTGKTTPANVADHIVPHKGDPALFWQGALQSLCKACHDRHKQSQERTGLEVGSDSEGVPLDPQHPWNV